VPWELEDWIPLVQGSPTIADFYAATGLPGTQGIVSLYTRVRNAITDATNDAERRRHDSQKGSL
jgi:hypothetical protein